MPRFRRRGSSGDCISAETVNGYQTGGGRFVRTPRQGENEVDPRGKDQQNQPLPEGPFKATIPELKFQGVKSKGDGGPYRKDETVTLRSLAQTRKELIDGLEKESRNQPSLALQQRAIKNRQFEAGFVRFQDNLGKLKANANSLESVFATFGDSANILAKTPIGRATLTWLGSEFAENLLAGIYPNGAPHNQETEQTERNLSAAFATEAMKLLASKQLNQAGFNALMAGFAAGMRGSSGELYTGTISNENAKPKDKPVALAGVKLGDPAQAALLGALERRSGNTESNDLAEASRQALKFAGSEPTIPHLIDQLATLDKVDQNPISLDHKHTVNEKRRESSHAEKKDADSSKPAAPLIGRKRKTPGEQHVDWTSIKSKPVNPSSVQSDRFTEQLAGIQAQMTAMQSASASQNRDTIGALNQIADQLGQTAVLLTQRSNSGETQAEQFTQVIQHFSALLRQFDERLNTDDSKKDLSAKNAAIAKLQEQVSVLEAQMKAGNGGSSIDSPPSIDSKARDQLPLPEPAAEQDNKGSGPVIANGWDIAGASDNNHLGLPDTGALASIEREAPPPVQPPVVEARPPEPLPEPAAEQSSSRHAAAENIATSELGNSTDTANTTAKPESTGPMLAQGGIPVDGSADVLTDRPATSAGSTSGATSRTDTLSTEESRPPTAIDVSMTGSADPSNAQDVGLGNSERPSGAPAKNTTRPRLTTGDFWRFAPDARSQQNVIDSIVARLHQTRTDEGLRDVKSTVAVRGGNVSDDPPETSDDSDPVAIASSSVEFGRVRAKALAPTGNFQPPSRDLVKQLTTSAEEAGRKFAESLQRSPAKRVNLRSQLIDVVEAQVQGEIDRVKLFQASSKGASGPLLHAMLEDEWSTADQAARDAVFAGMVGTLASQEHRESFADVLLATAARLEKEPSLARLLDYTKSMIQRLEKQAGQDTGWSTALDNARKNAEGRQRALDDSQAASTPLAQMFQEQFLPPTDADEPAAVETALDFGASMAQAVRDTEPGLRIPLLIEFLKIVTEANRLHGNPAAGLASKSEAYWAMMDPLLETLDEDMITRVLDGALAHASQERDWSVLEEAVYLAERKSRQKGFDRSGPSPVEHVMSALKDLFTAGGEAPLGRPDAAQDAMLLISNRLQLIREQLPDLPSGPLERVEKTHDASASLAATPSFYRATALAVADELRLGHSREPFDAAALIEVFKMAAAEISDDADREEFLGALADQVNINALTGFAEATLAFVNDGSRDADESLPSFNAIFRAAEKRLPQAMESLDDPQRVGELRAGISQWRESFSIDETPPLPEPPHIADRPKVEPAQVRSASVQHSTAALSVTPEQPSSDAEPRAPAASPNQLTTSSEPWSSTSFGESWPAGDELAEPNDAWPSPADRRIAEQPRTMPVELELLSAASNAETGLSNVEPANVVPTATNNAERTGAPPQLARVDATPFEEVREPASSSSSAQNAAASTTVAPPLATSSAPPSPAQLAIARIRGAQPGDYRNVIVQVGQTIASEADRLTSQEVGAICQSLARQFTGKAGCITSDLPASILASHQRRDGPVTEDVDRRAAGWALSLMLSGGAAFNPALEEAFLGFAFANPRDADFIRRVGQHMYTLGVLAGRSYAARRSPGATDELVNRVKGKAAADTTTGRQKPELKRTAERGICAGLEAAAEPHSVGRALGTSILAEAAVIRRLIENKKITESKSK